MEFNVTYQGSRPCVPGYPLYYMTFKLDNGKEKTIRAYYNKLLDLLKELNLKIGDKITIKEQKGKYTFYK